MGPTLWLANGSSGARAGFYEVHGEREGGAGGEVVRGCDGHCHRVGASGGWCACDGPGGRVDGQARGQAGGRPGVETRAAGGAEGGGVGRAEQGLREGCGGSSSQP